MMNEEWKNEEGRGEGEAFAPEEDSRTSEPKAGLFSDLKYPYPRLAITPQLMLVALLLVGVFGVGATPFILSKLHNDNQEQTANVSSSSEKKGEDNQSSPWDDLSIIAPSAIVVDVNSGKILFEKKPDEQLPLASLTKLMTALIAREIVDDGLVVPVTGAALSQAGDSGLLEGERFSFKVFLDLTLMTSSNDGAYAMAAAAGKALDQDNPTTAFVKAMNVRAKELGLVQTYFRNPTGLDISETEAGAYGTAREVAKLLEYLIENYPEILEETTVSESYIYNESGKSHEAVNTNRVTDAVANLLASKTGYTTLAGGNLAIAFDAGLSRTVIVVVLGSTHQGRFSDVLALVEAAREAIKNED